MSAVLEVVVAHARPALTNLGVTSVKPQNVGLAVSKHTNFRPCHPWGALFRCAVQTTSVIAYCKKRTAIYGLKNCKLNAAFDSSC